MSDLAPPAPSLSLGFARFLVFSSSAAVLVLEILAGRLMAPYVGVSLETFTGIIGVILAGIALGTSIGGRLADRYDPAALLGPAFVLGGALSWWSLWVVVALGPELGRGPVAIVALTTIGFFTPAAVLSAVSPFVTKLRLRSIDETGTVVGSLSAWGTGGALFGVFVTGFVLVAALPTKPIVISLGVLLVVAGGALTGWQTRQAPSAALLAGVIVSFGIGVTSTSPCEFESAYFCGRVVVDADDPSVRSLVLDNLVHASVDLDDPEDLQIRYVRLLASAIDARDPGPLDAVHIGGGGFTVPAHVSRTRPGSTNTVFEIDDVLFGIAREELGYEPDAQTTVRIGDARLLLTDLDDESTDVVVGDAFGGAAVPWHLTTSEFVAEIDRILRPDGVYMVNVIDGGENRFAEWQVRTMLEHFEHVAVIVPFGEMPGRVANQILLGSDVPIEPFALAADGAWVDDAAAFSSDGRVLTDDYAPVDQLVTTRN